MWQKTLSAALVVTVVLTAILLISEKQKTCCLCDSFRYHAPCLIDLETGDLVELDLYFPHAAKTAELADLQLEISTVSFVYLGNVTGIKQTGSKTATLHVPAADKTRDPDLCNTCRKLLQEGYYGRYVLADLYNAEVKSLFPIVNGTEKILRCYKITMTQGKEKDWVTVIVQGLLDTVSICTWQQSRKTDLA